MMRLTARVKKFLVDNCGVKAGASDEDFKKAAGAALADGTLTVEKYTELSTTKSDEQANEFGLLLKSLGSAVTELKAAMVAEKATEDEDDSEDEVEGDEEAETKTTMTKVKGGKTKTGLVKSHKPSNLERLVTQGWSPDDDGDGEEKSFHIRSKEAIENYDASTKTMTYPSHTKGGKPHPLAGRPVVDYTEPGKSHTLNIPSERDMAIAGSYGKFLVNTAQKGGSKTLGFQTLPEHDKQVLYWAMENADWSGASDGGDTADIKRRRLSPREQKALIDDATSGGLEAAPIVFDDQIIQTPLLHGELYPLVNTIPLDRGRRVEGVATGTVTGGWGGVDDTAISLFTTTSYVTAFDTTIFRWEGAILIGLDFLSDTPIDFGQHITTQYGERLLEDLDDVIATGNGTTQPEGVMTKSGATSVSFGGATSIGNYESLRFGVAKVEHRSNVKASAIFCGNETSYQRARAIPVGASDARRLGGMDYDSYQWMERPYKINAGMANTDIFYCIMARYRMYRRRGLTIRTSTEGSTLIKANEMLITATARYGGQLERGAVCARTTTAPA